MYGGRSGEHEVSIASAASIFRHLDRSRYEPVPIRIAKDGRWYLDAEPPTASSAATVHAQGTGGAPGQSVEPTRAVNPSSVDVVFPVLHGPYGEDGTVQGLLELQDVAYVSAGVLGAAAGMDKAVMKKLFAADGLPVCPYVVLLRQEWVQDRGAVEARIASLGYPVFVKPANLGSSVGISKVRSAAEIGDAVALALQYDRKVVVEAAVPEAREIECAVLGNDDPRASVPGEIVPSREFYDYEAKYLEEGSRLLIPAPLEAAQAAEIQRLAVRAFRAVEGAGLSRVDFLVARASGTVYLNEVNTMPGFTTISMYPKMWEASGLAYPALLDRLIDLAVERHREKQQLKTSIT